jgi:hypothetical protein
MFSKPVYRDGPSALPAIQRLVVMQGIALAARVVELAALPQPLKMLCLGEGVALDEKLEVFADAGELDSRLRALLVEAEVGTRLYACGDESFLWHIHQLGRLGGLLGEEIELIRAGDTRRMYCVHCTTLQDIGAVEEVHCRECGVRLYVREHFSQRLGAYMGVCIDADNPYGEARP